MPILILYKIPKINYAYSDDALNIDSSNCAVFLKGCKAEVGKAEVSTKQEMCQWVSAPENI